MGKHASSDRPALTHADLMLLALIVSSDSTDIASLAVDFQFFEGSLLTYDQASYGLQRLAAAGLIRIPTPPGNDLRFQATEAAIALRDGIGGNELALTTLVQRLGQAFADTTEGPSRAGGSKRFPNLSEQAFDTAVGPQQAWRDKVPSDVVERLRPGLRPRDIKRR